MDSLVSIIIPVYNTAKYLDACLESVVNQTYSDLQIILIDDGSTDGISPGMCDLWGKKDNRIQVIHKENEGLGFTRNAGLDVAKGQFVCFLDSDDTLDLDAISYCVKELSLKEADACFYGRKTQHKDGTFTVNEQIPKKLDFTGDEIKSEFAKIYIGRLPEEDNTSYIQASACCAMYNRDVIEKNNIRFLSERECLSEDTFFNLQVCRYAKRVIILPKDFYNYSYNANSLTKSYNPNKINQTKTFFQYLQQYAQYFPEMDQVDKRVLYSFYIYFRHAMEYEVKAWRINGIKDTYKRIKGLCRDTYFVEEMQKVSKLDLGWKRKIFVFLFLTKQVLLLMAYYMRAER